MPLDPQVKALLDQVAALNAPPIWELTPEQARQSFKAMTVMAGPGEDVSSVENRTVPGPAGDLPVRIYRPSEERPLPVLLFIVWIGVYPAAFTGKTEATIAALLAQVESKASVAFLPR